MTKFFKHNYVVEVESNLINNRYITDGNIWTIDETIFNDTTKLFLMVSLKTRAILGYIIHEDNINDDLIIELYQKVLDRYHNESVLIIHSDTEPKFRSNRIKDFLEEEIIKISTTKGSKNQNQVSEAINESIKALVTRVLIEKDSRLLRDWRKGLPKKFKYLPINSKIRDTDYRKLLFQSEFFRKKRFQAIIDAIARYNKRDFSKNMTREEAEYYNTKTTSKSFETMQLLSSNSLDAPKVKKENNESLRKVKKTIRLILNSDVSGEEKLAQITELYVEGHYETQDMLKAGLRSLSLQNAQLYGQNQDLLGQNDDLKNEIIFLQENISQLTNKIEAIMKEKQIKEERRDRRKKRKRLPKREPMTKQIYQFLLEESKELDYRSRFRAARIRIALSLLTVTGVRISELLPLKIKQVRGLFSDSFIAIDRLKRGPSNHKAFLTREGARLVKERLSDLEVISFIKNDDESFIFASENSNKPLSREVFNKLINNFIKDSIKKYQGKPNILSHSFRIGYITQLWRDTSDIEFVRQTIGHARLDTTSTYIEELSEEARKKRIDQISDPADLIQ